MLYVRFVGVKKLIIPHWHCCCRRNDFQQIKPRRVESLVGKRASNDPSYWPRNVKFNPYSAFAFIGTKAVLLWGSCGTSTNKRKSSTREEPFKMKI